MDDHDLALLRALQSDASQSGQALGERVGLSHSSVWRRLDALEAAGVIRARVALLDPARVGLGTHALTEITLRDHGSEARADFEALVRAAPEIMACYSITGRHDYRLEIRTRDTAAYEHFLMNRLLATPAVASAETAIVLREVKHTTAVPV